MEDCEWTIDRLREEGFSEMIVEAIDSNPTERDYERIAKYSKAITLIEQLEQYPAGC